MRKTFDSIDLDTSFSNTTGGGSTSTTNLDSIKAQISDIQAKVQKVNETVDLYNKEIAYIKPRIDKLQGKTKNGKHCWISGDNVEWCGSDADAAWSKAIRDLQTYQNYVASAPSLLKSYEQQLESLQKSLDRLSQSDPAVIQAQAQAQAALESAKSKSNTWKIIGLSIAGVILIGTIVWAVRRIRSKN